MRPFVYDLRRTLSSRAVLSLIILMIVSSLAVVPSLETAGAVPAWEQQATFLYVAHDFNGYHFIACTFNGLGQPVPKNYTISLSTQFMGQSLYSGTLVADASGIAFGTVETPGLAAGTPLYSSLGGQIVAMPTGPDGVAKPVGQWLSIVGNPKAPAEGAVLVFLAADNLAPPSGYKVYYAVTNGSQMYPQNVTGFKLLGTMQNYFAVFPPPSDLPLNGSYALVVMVSLPNGTLIQQSPPLGNGIFVARTAAFNADSLVSSVFSKIQTILVPLLGILGAYVAYGGDRTSGVLESILVRPITKRGLFLSRYAATVLALCFGAVATVITTDAVTLWASGAFLSPGLIVGMATSMAVEVAAFVGITFLLSHVLRSNGGLILTAIGLFLVLDLLWGNVVLSFFVPSEGPYMTVLNLQVQIYSDLLNPSQFIALEEIFRQAIVNMNLGQTLGGLEVPVSYFGLTAWSLAVDGAIWILAPVAASLLIMKKKD